MVAVIRQDGVSNAYSHIVEAFVIRYQTSTRPWCKIRFPRTHRAPAQIHIPEDASSCISPFQTHRISRRNSYKIEPMRHHMVKLNLHHRGPWRDGEECTLTYFNSMQDIQILPIAVVKTSVVAVRCFLFDNTAPLGAHGVLGHPMAINSCATKL